jgi:hypothetical protein
VTRSNPVSSRGHLFALAILTAIGGCTSGEAGDVPAVTSTVFPEIGQYKGEPLEFGRTEPIARFAAR